jgi:hypothetical protein
MASINLDIKSEIPKAIRWTDAMTKRLPWAIADSMTQAAKDARQYLREVTPRYIDRPTNWTLNSTFVKFATPRRLTSEVGFKYFGGGVPAGRYLETLARGGSRAAKSTERQLQQAGVLRSGQFIVPTGVTPLKLNSYGNLSGSSYTQVLSRLGAMTVQGSSQNVNKAAARSNNKRASRDFFAANISGHYGIMARVGKAPKGNPGGRGRPITSNLRRGYHTVFYVTRQPRYQPRFPIQTILQTTFNARYASIFPSRLARELEKYG